MVQKNEIKELVQEDLMLHPIVCQNERLRQYLQNFRGLFSRPQYGHFETVLFGLLMSKEGHTLSHLHRAIAGIKSVSSVSRFFGQAPWDHQVVNQHNFYRFCNMVHEKIEQERQRMRDQQPKRRGRYKEPFVTGYLIGDDSTMSKPKGKKMEGLGKHHSTTYDKRIKGHSLVECLYTVVDRSCPLEPLLYRQKVTAEKEEVPFLSKIDLMLQQIENFIPPAGTETHVLLDSWYSAKKIWKAARKQDFKITTGIKCNRSLRVPCSNDSSGWKWQKLTDYAAALPNSAYQECHWPRNPERKVWVHVVDTRVKSLYRCKLVVVRQSLDDPISAGRFWASSDLEADAQALLGHISKRWDIEVFFEDMKELLGIDQYQLMTTTALLRYWTFCWVAFSFLEEVRYQLKQQNNKKEVQHATLGEARYHVQKIHDKLFLEWVYKHALSGTPVEDLFTSLVA
jgi:SRSO17 transposase